MTLIQRNAEQLRKIAQQNTKDLQDRHSNPTNFTNITDTMKIDIASMRNSVAEQKINNYLSVDVAEEELLQTLTHYQMIKMKETVLTFIAHITQQSPSAFTLRTTAEFISDFANEFKIKYNIKD